MLTVLVPSLAHTGAMGSRLRSLCLWGHKMANQNVLFFTDNEALVHVINEQSCKGSALIVLFVLVCHKNNIVFKVKHISGICNNLADPLSRLQVQTFGQRAPKHMDRLPTSFPLYLRPQSWDL